MQALGDLFSLKKFFTFLTGNPSDFPLKNKCEAVFQPILKETSKNSGDFQIIAFESLLRERDNNGDLLPPPDLLNEIKSNDQQTELFFHMLEKACIFINKAKTEGYDEDFYVSVNIDIHPLCDKELTDKVLNTLSEYGVEPNRIMVEVIEDKIPEHNNSNYVPLISATPDSATLLNNLIILREHGVGIGLDDCGAKGGHTNLERIMDFLNATTKDGLPPFTLIKIDKIFTPSAAGITVAKAIGVLNKTHIPTLIKHLSHDINVISEGIETRQDLETASTSFNNGYYQGYLFYKPLEFRQALHTFGNNRVMRLDDDATTQNAYDTNQPPEILH